MSLLAKFCAEKKKDKIKFNGTIVDLQVTNLFLNMCEKDAIPKVRSLIPKVRSPRNLIDTPYKDIKLAVQIHFSPKERAVTAAGLNICP